MRSNGKDEIQKLSGRVLIADDDPQFRDLLVRLAEKMELSVLEVEDGNEPMETLERERLDSIVFDHYMPSHTGLEVIQKAQENHPEIRHILLTASATVERTIDWTLV